MCALRTLALAMMEVSYWNGLQMLQYSSVVRADGPVVELVGIGHIVVPLIAVILPRDIGRDEVVSNARDGGRWNGENGVVRIGVRERVVTIPEVAWIVIVQQVVTARLAVRIDRVRQRFQICSRMGATPAELCPSSWCRTRHRRKLNRRNHFHNHPPYTSYWCRWPGSGFLLHPLHRRWAYPWPLQRCEAEWWRSPCRR